MHIGRHAVDMPLFLSPMVDVTDAAFRSIARDHGADVTCSEMIGAAGLLHDNPGSWRMTTPGPGEAPYGVQLMGGDAAQMADAVHRVAEAHAGAIDFIDLNLGCPSPKILRACAGAFLTRDPRLAGAVVGAAVAAGEEHGLPVSVKMRLGHDDAHRTFLDVGNAVQAAGAAWVTLHGRTVVQGYSGQADWQAIAQLVDHLDVPVVGNGDVTDPESAVALRDQTGCHGLFIGRAALHDPTCFRRLRAGLQGKEPESPPDLPSRIITAHLYLDRAQSGPCPHDIGYLRRQVTRFMQGTPGARKLRGAVQGAANVDDLRNLLNELGAAS